MDDRRPTMMDRRRRRARIVAIVVALAFVATATLPLIAFAAPQGQAGPALAEASGVDPWVVGVLGLAAIGAALVTIIIRIRRPPGD
ncbi:hypothetical protein J4G33_03780 [Actinotalea sp. BY-33]|uniref:Uncharacterized protein n=1 Tax=Actinotalea soli TaxID=2819234 RepID=A0A939LNC4_9CELL|nr:hypothetical protein [Actinotalea soli]MBO1750916.1 hypothetical protein [Actinotalea soli]